MTTNPKRNLKVFLCHSSHDKSSVREIYRRLKAERWIDPWLDDEKLFPGQDWDLEIEKAVEQTDVVLVFLSNNSVSKEGYIQKELRFILNIAEYKPEGTLFILPLRLDECPLPTRLRSWHYVDNFPQAQKEWAYGRLLGSLKIRAEKVGVDVATLFKEDELSEEERKEKEVRDAARKDEHMRIAKEKQEAEEERERKTSVEKARVGRKTEEKAHQAAVRKERHRERIENTLQFFSRNGKRFSFIGGWVVLLFLFGYVISNIELPAKPAPTQIPTSSIPVTSTASLPASTPTITFTVEPPTLTPTEAVGDKVPNISDIKSSWQTVINEDFSLKTKNWDNFYNWDKVEDGKYRSDCTANCAWGVAPSKTIGSDNFFLEFETEFVDDFDCKSLQMESESGLKTCGYVAVDLGNAFYIVFDLNRGEMFVNTAIWLNGKNVLSVSAYPAIRSGKGKWNTIQIVNYNSEIFIVANDFLLGSFPVEEKQLDYFGWVVYSDTFVYIDNVRYLEKH